MSTKAWTSRTAWSPDQVNDANDVVDDGLDDGLDGFLSVAQLVREYDAFMMSHGDRTAC